MGLIHPIQELCEFVWVVVGCVNTELGRHGRGGRGKEGVVRTSTLQVNPSKTNFQYEEPVLILLEAPKDLEAFLRVAVTLYSSPSLFNTTLITFSIWFI